jgi:hypothetical protein
MFRTKIVRAETKLLDDKGGRVSAVVSSESADRDGDVVRVDGWDLTAFQKYPVLLSSHEYRSLRSVIGEWESMEVHGKQLIGTAKYFVGEGNEEADWGFNLAKRGRAAFSVGFIPDMTKASPLGNVETDGLTAFQPMEFKGQELLEVSHVTIPSNPDALQRMKALDLEPALADVVDEILTDHEPQSDGYDRAELDARFDRLEAAIKQVSNLMVIDQAARAKAQQILLDRERAEDLKAVIRRAAAMAVKEM